MIAEDLGRLFEVGFNIGILAYIRENNIKHKFGTFFEKDLQELRFSKMHPRIVDRARVVDESDRQTIGKWSLFFLQKGFLCGLNFFREYLEAAKWDLKKLEILYFQCNFRGENTVGTHPQSEEEGFYSLLSQLGNVKVDIGRYQQKGEFLKADTLMLLRYRKKFRILSVDLSVFSVKSAEDIKDLDDVEILRRYLLREIKYLRSKSVFSQLSIDTGDLDFKFSPDLVRYFTAFKTKDKESAKLIQAGSYAYSFYQFLLSTKILPATDLRLTFNVFGYSDRGVSAMSLHPHQIDILQTCAHIYKQEDKKQAIDDARDIVWRTISRNAAKSFINGRKFMQDLSSASGNGVTRITHQEKITVFNSIANVPPEIMAQVGLTGTMNLRDAHAALIEKALIAKENYLFLTGNPGIGKTTAIVEFLKQHMDEGFLFLYISPRIQVNRDIIEKFKQGDRLCDDRLFCINSNSDIIKSNMGRCTVQYQTNLRQGEFKEKGVHFLDSDMILRRREEYQQRLKRTNEDLIQDGGQRTRGVLSSVCDAIGTMVERGISNNIIATVSVQSFKKTAHGKDTLEHFNKIFRTVYNEREGSVNPAKMQAISQRIKHLFVMIDEITGDDSGVEFFRGISQLARDYELMDGTHGFNTKIIVADASIVNSEVIRQHMGDREVAPDKIFFRPASGPGSPLSVEQFDYGRSRSPATLINANSYPARSLDITYKVFIESSQFKDSELYDKSNVVDRVQTEITADLNELLNRPDAGQIIVYIQDKQRLKNLTEKLKEDRGQFEQFVDYLEIHSNISESYKQELQKHKNDVKVIFMTSSASRGLSFPKTKHILVDIPRFQIERNLMEAIQVIYRGRGEYIENGERKTRDGEDKYLTFYLYEQAIYYGEEPEKELRESKLSLANILLILKTAVMTRIAGAGQIGKKHYMMIPIGGKSVFAAGDTFSGSMAALIGELKREHIRRRTDILLNEVHQSLRQLLARARIVLTDAEKSGLPQTVDYLSVRETLGKSFEKLANKGFDGLLKFGNLEAGHISGSLLLVSLKDKNLQENYEIRLEQIFKHDADDDFLHQLRKISKSRHYPESLRSATRGAIELVNKLLEGRENRTQRYEQNSQRTDQYYALPLLAFISSEAMRDYFVQGIEEPEQKTFRELLSLYVRSLYPADNMLPIGYNYEKFPFVVFRSYSLTEIRNKLFTDKQLLNSHELNVLNLILAQDE